MESISPFILVLLIISQTRERWKTFCFFLYLHTRRYSTIEQREKLSSFKRTKIETLLLRRVSPWNVIIIRMCLIKKKIFVVTSCPPNFHTNPLTRNFDHNRRISSRESAKTSAKYSNVNIRQRNSWKNCPTQISREKETLYQLYIYIYIYSMVDSINVSLNCEFPRSTSTK